VKIAIFDPYRGRFTNDMVNWWRREGHEVKTDLYYDPELVLWADLVWFDTCDNNIKSATNPGEAILGAKFFNNTEIPWDMHEMDLTGKTIVCRPIDIEVWQGHHADARIWDLVDHCIFIAPHIRDLMMADSRPQESDMKIHVIPCGVELSRWTYKERTPGKKVAIVAERWVSKGTDYIIQLAMMLPTYEFHWLGTDNDYNWEAEYLRDKIAKKCPNIILHEEYVEDLDEWLDDKDYLLSASHKEAFGYSIAEAMAKGIKPIVHEFYGFEPLWGDSGYTWATLQEAYDLITKYDYYSSDYLHYLTKKGYTTDQMMERIMEAING